jgi:hypothetical protein
MQAPSAPIIVRVVERNEVMGLGDVLLDALGLTGALTVGAVVFGLLLAVMFIGYRKLKTRLEPDDQVPQTQPLGLTPPQ